MAGRFVLGLETSSIAQRRRPRRFLRMGSLTTIVNILERLVQANNSTDTDTPNSTDQVSIIGRPNDYWISKRT